MRLLAKTGPVLGVVLGLLVAAIVLAPSAPTADARPAYKNAFAKKYTKFKKVECNVCHEGEEKKDRNEYAKALATALDGTNVKDAKKIEKALSKIEKEKDADGKPYSDKLKKGKNPTG